MGAVAPWLVECASVMLPTFCLFENCPGGTHTLRDRNQVFEWRFVTHMPCTVVKSKLFVCWCIVGCLGHYSPFVCLIIILADTVGVGWVWLGCCVRTV